MGLQVRERSQEAALQGDGQVPVQAHPGPQPAGPFPACQALEQLACKQWQPGLEAEGGQPLQESHQLLALAASLEARVTVLRLGF